MKIEDIEPQNVGIMLGDPDFNLARVWRGRLSDGTAVLLYVAAVVARDRRDQANVDDALRALPPLGLLVTSHEALDFAKLEVASQEKAA